LRSSTWLGERLTIEGVARHSRPWPEPSHDLVNGLTQEVAKPVPPRRGTGHRGARRRPPRDRSRGCWGGSRRERRRRQVV